MHRLTTTVVAIAASLVPVQGVSACTIAAFGPSSTVDGRPMLWKNRDVNNQNQEAHYFAGGRYRFVGNIYAGDEDNCWGGINEAGFGIMNSDSENIGGFDSDDGMVMKLVLGTCATIDDFAALMDSLNEIGRARAANFGVFDATGRVAMFEAANTWYKIYDEDEDSLGFLVRANYSMCGDTNRQTGKARYERAMQLIVPEFRQHRISVEFVVRILTRDIGSTEFNPYPLPFKGQYEGLPYGFLPCGNCLGRPTTRSAEIMVGPKPGEPSGTGMMWIMLGTPFVAIPVPMWASGGTLPQAVDGDETSEICDRAIDLRNYIFPDPGLPSAVNTFSVNAALGFFAPTEANIFEMVREAQARWAGRTPDSAEAWNVTASACEQVIDAYDAFLGQFDWVVAGPEQVPDSRMTLVRDQLVARMPRGVDRVRVYDAQGRLVAGLSLPPGTDLLTWDTSGLPAGGYFLVFPDDTGIDLPPARFVKVD
jgi:hypothetical protein